MAFYGHYYDTDPAVRKQLRRVRIVYPLCCLLLGLSMYLGSDNDWSVLVLWGAAALVLGILFIPKVNRPRWLGRMRKQTDVPENRNMTGRRTVEFGDEIVKITSDISESAMQWDAFVRFAESPEYFFLYISALQAHIIPKRAMSAAEVDGLRQILNNKIKK